MVATIIITPSMDAHKNERQAFLKCESTNSKWRRLADENTVGKGEALKNKKDGCRSQGKPRGEDQIA